MCHLESQDLDTNATYVRIRSIDEVTGNTTRKSCHAQRAFFERHCNLTESSDQKIGGILKRRLHGLLDLAWTACPKRLRAFNESDHQCSVKQILVFLILDVVEDRRT